MEDKPRKCNSGKQRQQAAFVWVGTVKILEQALPFHTSNAASVGHLVTNTRIHQSQKHVDTHSGEVTSRGASYNQADYDYDEKKMRMKKQKSRWKRL